MLNQDLYDKVVYYKGRVWTIYALSDDQGVFAYQGLKPYSTFVYNENRINRNVSYISLQEALECIVDGDKIEDCIKNEKKAESKKLNKKMAVDFLAYLTGHTKSKINSEIQENYNGGFQIVLGEVSYDLWKKEGRLHLHHNLHQHAMGATFDFVTWRHD
ncbi:hypothetical protein, partial [Mycobacterium tuberculosis]